VAWFWHAWQSFHPLAVLCSLSPWPPGSCLFSCGKNGSRDLDCREWQEMLGLEKWTARVELGSPQGQ
jgi:hypothetical protein